MMRAIAAGGAAVLLAVWYFGPLPVVGLVVREGVTPLLPSGILSEASPAGEPSTVFEPTRSGPGPGSAPPAFRRSTGIEINSARLLTDTVTTTFEMILSRGVTAEVFTLANPYRVVVDLPDAKFSLPPGTGKEGAGLVREFRYGLFAEGQGRVVLDTHGPVRIDRAEMLPHGDEVAFAIRLKAVTADQFGAGTGADLQKKSGAKPAPATQIATAKDKAKPVIVIDPGHGGIDPGAVGSSNLLEKNLVLAVALKLNEKLKAAGRYDVRMTRTADVFLSLDDRLQASQEANADLFVSLHADSIAELNAAVSVRGATVYTLSSRASDEQARRMAEKENASDLLAGIASDESGTADDVKSILIDLMQRESANFSTDFSNVLVGQLRRSISLARDPQRSAAFKVLKQTHAPSVLLELGYLSHPEDARLMNNSSWQSEVAGSILAAIDDYFARRTAVIR